MQDDKERTRRELRSNIARLRNDQANAKARLSRLDSRSREAQNIINTIAGLEAEITSNEMNLRRL